MSVLKTCELIGLFLRPPSRSESEKDRPPSRSGRSKQPVLGTLGIQQLLGLNEDDPGQKE